MRILLYVLLFCLTPILVVAQGRYQVAGKVTDSAAKVNLLQASISVLNANDSTLVKFGWADANGDYQIENLKIGRFILLVCYPEYADYVQQFTLDSIRTQHDFGLINLTSKARLLNEVIITGKVSAIKIKGDTTEFNARAFVIQPNAKVEDLLKQLPGIQIDNKGKITAHGQVVKKVLVDGEEFFGNDPTLVTRNLRGDMIDKVQLYDKKSDQASFTGVDDGIKDKTINLKLKEDKKRGYFGKIDAGAGTDDFYQVQAMANLFREKQKVAVYGNIGNTGRTGLNGSENNRYGTNGGTIEFVSGGITLVGSNADEIESNSGRYNGQGIPLANTSGAHYDRKWNKDKESINTNVKIGSLQIDGSRNVITQNDLPTGIILSNLQQHFSTYNFRQRIDAAYLINIDKTTSFKVKIDGISKQSESEDNYEGSSLDKDLMLLNRTKRKLNYEGNQHALNLDAFYSKKLKKEGRTFSWNVVGAVNGENTAGYLNAVNDFYNADGSLNNNQTISQYKTNNKSLTALNNNITFSEAFSKTFSLLLNYRLGLINNKADRKSFNPSSTGSYTVFDSEFSNDFVLTQFSNQGGAMFTYQKAKQKIAFGSKVTAVDFKQLDRYANLTYRRNFLNFIPQASYQFRPSSQRTFQLNYYGNTIQPSVDQIQPIKVNTDPLNVFVGNADLAPAFKHDFSLSYNSYQTITGLSINLISSYDLTKNPIVNSVNTDQLGRSTYQVINLPDNNTDNFVLRGSLGKQVKSISGFIGLNFFFNSRTDYGISNGATNKRKNNVLTSSIDFSKFKEKKYDVLVGFGPRIFAGSSSLQNQLTNNGYGYDGYMDLTLYLFSKFEFRTNANFNYQSKTQSFNEAFQAFIINASISKKFLKDETLKFSIAANDILNQNTGFNRSSFGTMITQNSYTTIARYFMCSLTWDFSKFGKTLAN